MSWFSRSTTTWQTPEEVADALKVGVDVVDQLIEKGELEAVQVGSVWRVPREALAAFRQRHSSRRPTKKRLLRAAAIPAAVGVLLLAAAVIHAQSAEVPDPSTIPYQGYVEYQGEPADGPMRITFSLEDQAGTPLAWTEQHDVMTSAGRFTAQLGRNAGNPLADFLGQGPLYLRVNVQGLDTEWNPVGASVALDGRQLLASVPYALRGAPGKDFAVDGSLLAATGAITSGLTAGSVTANDSITAASAAVSGGLSAGSVSVSGAVNANGSLNAVGGVSDNGNRVFSATTMFESAALSWTYNFKVSAAHGLGGTPRFATVMFRCITAERGYEVGDEVVAETGTYDPGTGRYYATSSLYYNETEVGYVVDDGVVAIHGTAPDQQNISNANWRIVLRAWR